MKKALVTLGLITICGYAVTGLMLMNNWAVVAGSQLELDETIKAMNAADQDYNILNGMVFAALGLLLAGIWAWITLSNRVTTSPWLAGALWSLILMFGAPAYFFASFANMNSVGDTFADWDIEAAAAFELPLYLVSGGALILLFVILAAWLALVMSHARLRSHPASS